MYSQIFLQLIKVSQFDKSLHPLLLKPFILIVRRERSAQKSLNMYVSKNYLSEIILMSDVSNLCKQQNCEGKIFFLASSTSNESQLECFLLIFLFFIKATAYCEGRPTSITSSRGVQTMFLLTVLLKGILCGLFPLLPLRRKILGSLVFIFLPFFCAIHHFSRCTRAYGRRL